MPVVYPIELVNVNQVVDFECVLGRTEGIWRAGRLRIRSGRNFITRCIFGLQAECTYSKVHRGPHCHNREALPVRRRYAGVDQLQRYTFKPVWVRGQRRSGCVVRIPHDLE